MSKPVDKAVSIVESAKKELNAALASPEFVHNRLELNGLFDRMLTRLRFMGGVVEPSKSNTPTKFGPITSFMGEKIVKTSRIAAGDLNPREAEKRVYLEKVDKLYETLTETDIATILKNYTIPEDVLVVRGVAKRAGVADYETRELNVSFIEDIALAIEMKEEEAGTQRAIDEAAKAEKEKADIEKAEKEKAEKEMADAKNNEAKAAAKNEKGSK